jgi:hypothetical protein
MQQTAQPAKDTQSISKKPRHLFNDILERRNVELDIDQENLRSYDAILNEISKEHNLNNEHLPTYNLNEPYLTSKQIKALEKISKEEKRVLFRKLIKNLVNNGIPDDTDPNEKILFKHLFLEEEMSKKNFLDVNPETLRKHTRLMEEIGTKISPIFDSQSINLTDENTSYQLKNITITVLGVGTALLVGYLMIPLGTLFTASSITTTMTAATAAMKTPAATVVAAEAAIETAQKIMDAAKRIMQLKKQSSPQPFWHLDRQIEQTEIDKYEFNMATYKDAVEEYKKQAGIFEKQQKIGIEAEKEHNKHAELYNTNLKEFAKLSTEIAGALLGLPQTVSIMLKVYTIISSGAQGKDIKESIQIMLQTGSKEALKFGVTFVVGAYTNRPENAVKIEKFNKVIQENLPTSVTNFFNNRYTDYSNRKESIVKTISTSAVGNFVGQVKDAVYDMLPQSITDAEDPLNQAIVSFCGYMKSSAIIYATNTGLEGFMNNVKFLKASKKEKQLIEDEEENRKLMEKQQEFIDLEFEIENGFKSTSRVLKNMYSEFKLNLNSVSKNHPYIATMMILITANFGARYMCDIVINNAEFGIRYAASFLPFENTDDMIDYVKETKVIHEDQVRKEIYRQLFPHLAKIVNDILPLKKIIMEEVQKKIKLKPDEYFTYEKFIKRELTIMALVKNFMYMFTNITIDIAQEGLIMNSLTLTGEEFDKHMAKIKEWYESVPTTLNNNINSLFSKITDLSDGVYSFLYKFFKFFSSNTDDSNNVGDQIASEYLKAVSSQVKPDEPSIIPGVIPEIPDEPIVIPNRNIENSTSVVGQTFGNPVINIVANLVNGTFVASQQLKYPKVSNIATVFNDGITKGIQHAISMTDPSDLKDTEITCVMEIKDTVNILRTRVSNLIFKNLENIKVLSEHIDKYTKILNSESSNLPTNVLESMTKEITRWTGLKDNIERINENNRKNLQEINSHILVPDGILVNPNRNNYLELVKWFTNIFPTIERDTEPEMREIPEIINIGHMDSLIASGEQHYNAYKALKASSTDPEKFRPYTQAGTGQLPFSSMTIDEIKEQTLICTEMKNQLAFITKMNGDLDNMNSDLDKFNSIASLGNSNNAGMNLVFCGDNLTCKEFLQNQRTNLQRMREDLNITKDWLETIIHSNFEDMIYGASKPLPSLPKYNLEGFKGEVKKFTDKLKTYKNVSSTKEGVLSFVPTDTTQLSNFNRLINWFEDLTADTESAEALKFYLDKNNVKLSDLFSGLLIPNADISFSKGLDDLTSAIGVMKDVIAINKTNSINIQNAKSKAKQAKYDTESLQMHSGNVHGLSKKQREENEQYQKLIANAKRQGDRINDLNDANNNAVTQFENDVSNLFRNIKTGTPITPDLLEGMNKKKASLGGNQGVIDNIGSEINNITKDYTDSFNKNVFGIGKKEIIPPNELSPEKEAEQANTAEKPFTTEEIRLYSRTKTANRLQFFLQHKNMLQNSVSQKIKNLLSLITPEALQQKQGLELSLEEQLIIDLAHQEILDNITSDPDTNKPPPDGKPKDSYNIPIIAALEMPELPELNIHSFGQMVSMGKDKMYAYGTSGVVISGTAIVFATNPLSIPAGLAAKTAAMIGTTRLVAQGAVLASELASNPLAQIYGETFAIMDKYLNLGESDMMNQARNAAQFINTVNKAKKENKDLNSQLGNFENDMMYWSTQGLGRLKDSMVVIDKKDVTPPTVGKFNLPKLLLANALTGGGANLREAFYEAYNVKGEKSWWDYGGYLLTDKWDKVIKMFNVGINSALSNEELIPIVFGDNHGLSPDQLMDDISIKWQRIRTYGNRYSIRNLANFDFTNPSSINPVTVSHDLKAIAPPQTDTTALRPDQCALNQCSLRPDQCTDQQHFNSLDAKSAALLALGGPGVPDPFKLLALLPPNPLDLLALMPPDRLTNLPPEVLAILQQKRLALSGPGVIMPPELLALLPPNPISPLHLLALYPPGTLALMPPEVLAIMPPEVLALMPPEVLALLPPEVLALLPPEVLALLPPDDSKKIPKPVSENEAPEVIVEKNKILSEVGVWGWDQIKKLCAENKISPSIEYACIPVYKYRLLYEPGLRVLEPFRTPVRATGNKCLHGFKVNKKSDGTEYCGICINYPNNC